MKIEFNLNDTVWFHGGGDGLTSGQIIHIFMDGPQKLYVIRCETHIEPVYHVREYSTLSDSENKPIMLWRGIFSE